MGSSIYEDVFNQFFGKTLPTFEEFLQNELGLDTQMSRHFSQMMLKESLQGKELNRIWDKTPKDAFQKECEELDKWWF
jgi:hypothetical protein